jgi:molybdenum cofactor cytidylyltransferase
VTFEASSAPRVAAVVLAAGRGTRFRQDGGTRPKLLAPLHDRPVLQHVLDALATARLFEVTVVLGADADAIEEAIRWRDEQRVHNQEPERGLASSLQVGLAAVPTHAEATLVLLGDQPHVQPALIRQLARMPLDPRRPLVVPRYRDGLGNPVRLEREAMLLAFSLTDDAGMRGVIARFPELVRVVPVAGTNPDVDTPRDLEALGTS